jgi:hypothetical protein
VEIFLVDRMVNAMWRLQRLQRAEVALLHWRVYSCEVERRLPVVRSFEKTIPTPFCPPQLHEYETVTTDEAEHAKAGQALEEVRHERDRQEVFLGRSFHADATDSDAFGKLARYETAIDRGFYRTLHELQRLQAARQGRPVPAPQAVDVDVSIVGQE